MKENRYILYNNEILYDKKVKEHHFVPMDLASEYGFVLIPDKGSKDKRAFVAVLFEECDMVNADCELKSILYGRI